jgi:hypothetical protein
MKGDPVAADLREAKAGKKRTEINGKLLLWKLLFVT